MWPPVFQKYNEYQKQLDDAIALHPPFGEWLYTHRKVDIGHYPGHIQNDSMLHFTLDELKAKYVQAETLKRRINHASRSIVEKRLKETESLEIGWTAHWNAERMVYQDKMQKYMESPVHPRHKIKPTCPVCPPALVLNQHLRLVPARKRMVQLRAILWCIPRMLRWKHRAVGGIGGPMDGGMQGGMGGLA